MDNGNYYKIPNDLILRYGFYLKSNGIAVYNAIACHTNKNNKSKPSTRRIAALIGCSQNTVLKYVAILSKLRLIKIDKTNINNEYDITDISEWLPVEFVYSMDTASTIEALASTSEAMTASTSEATYATIEALASTSEAMTASTSEATASTSEATASTSDAEQYNNINILTITETQRDLWDTLKNSIIATLPLQQQKDNFKDATLINADGTNLIVEVSKATAKQLEYPGFKRLVSDCCSPFSIKFVGGSYA